VHRGLRTAGQRAESTALAFQCQGGSVPCLPGGVDVAECGARAVACNIDAFA
jgi:hypothetical protein